ncbi:hypothetical protein D3C71_2095220 [compost metagenome]
MHFFDIAFVEIADAARVVGDQGRLLRGAHAESVQGPAIQRNALADTGGKRLPVLAATAFGAARQRHAGKGGDRHLSVLLYFVAV